MRKVVHSMVANGYKGVKFTLQFLVVFKFFKILITNF